MGPHELEDIEKALTRGTQDEKPEPSEPRWRIPEAWKEMLSAIIGVTMGIAIFDELLRQERDKDREEEDI